MAIDVVHAGGAEWREPRDGEHFRTCSYCGCIHPEDLAAEIGPQGACSVCGQTGWEACFRGQKPPWFSQLPAAEIEKMRFEAANEIAAMEARNEPHSYDPGAAYASWADRKYGYPHKFYVENLRSREPERLYVITASSASEPPQGGNYQWFRYEDLPAGAVTAGWRPGDGKWFGLGTRETHHAKFYTDHLADPSVPDEAREKIHQACGLRFYFTDDGRMSWHALDCACDGHPSREES